MEEIISRKDARKLGWKFYFTGVPCKHGHVSKRRVNSRTCIGCEKAVGKLEKTKTYKKAHYEENKEEILIKNKEYRNKNKERLSEAKKNYYYKNREKCIEYSKKWVDENREYYNKYNRERNKSNLNAKTTKTCRAMLYRTLLATGKSKDKRSFKMLGYSNLDLINNIKGKFLDGMSWDNYGEWHIDHIVPICKYVDSGVSDPKVINSLDNLMPMWAKHNFEKTGRTLEEYLDVRPELYGVYGEFLTSQEDEDAT